MNKFLKFFTSTLGMKVDSYDENMVYGSVRFNNRASKLKTYSKKYYSYSKVDEEYIKEYYENNQGVLEILPASSSNLNKNISTKTIGCTVVGSGDDGVGGGGTLLQYEYIGFPEKLSSHKKCKNNNMNRPTTKKKGVDANKNKKVINNKKNIVERKRKLKSKELNSKYNRSNRICHFDIKSDSYYSFASSSSSLYCATPYAAAYESSGDIKNIVYSPRPRNKLVFNYNCGSSNIGEQRIFGGRRYNNTSIGGGSKSCTSINGGRKKENNDDKKYETVKIGNDVRIHADVHEKLGEMSGEKKEDKDDIEEKCIFTKSNECSVHSAGEFTKLPNLKTIAENYDDESSDYLQNDDSDDMTDLDDSPLLGKTTTSVPSKKCTKHVLAKDSKSIIDWFRNIVKWK